MSKKNEIKVELSKLVSEKMRLTRERVALKRVPYAERGDYGHRQMMALWCDCSIMKEDIRAMQLAYAYSRGRPYWTQERSTLHPVGSSMSRQIADATGSTVEEVKAWLSAPVSQADRDAFAAHLEASMAAAQAKREAARKLRLSAEAAE